LLQILLKCGFRVVHKFFNRNVQKPVFLLRPFGRLIAIVLKLIETVFTVFTNLIFWTL